ncbi:MAG: FtsW/RodA/SpoVE family cell cycle protein, partial [Candidatus Omnitrophica bacterium]|nr:FtsW/RodA/SpoVE family cell cycle protein [Candidatus Omnitrophota bacterium]
MREIRISLFVSFVFLVCFGIVMIYSSSSMYAMEVMKNSAYFLLRHLMFLVLGIALMIFCMMIDYRDLQKLSRPLLGVAIVLLILVLIPHIGKVTSGARRWFSLGPINFQPSELVKPVLIIYLADFFTRKKNAVKSLTKGFLPVMAVMGFLCALIIKQPDLGNTVLVFLITLSMFFVAGGRMKYIGTIFAEIGIV